MTTTSTTGTEISDDPVGMDRAAFDKTASVRAAMRPEDLKHWGLNAMYAIGKALWIAPRMAPFRAQMVALSGFDAAHLDWLADYARGLRFVHTEVVRRIERANQLPGLVDEGWKIRELLLDYAALLSKKGTVDPKVIEEVKKGSGHADLVLDLTVLVRELDSLPPAYTGPEAPATQADLARAVQIADQVNTAMGNGTDVDRNQAELVLERRKLGHLLVRAHSQIRRAMTYIRWDEGDVDQLVPSLYVAGPGRPRAKAEPEPGLAAVHQELHEHMTPPLDPEDNPFAPEE